jgi:hypothetical protein
MPNFEYAVTAEPKKYRVILVDIKGNERSSA